MIRANLTYGVAVVFAVAGCSRSADKSGGAPPANLSEAGAPAVVVPSPGAAKELALQTGETPIAVDVRPTGSEAVIAIKSANGRASLISWKIGDAAAKAIIDLPSGFEPAAVAAHPRSSTVFVAGKTGGKSQILAVTDSGGWKTRVIVESPNALADLVVGPLRFGADRRQFYRVFFSSTPRGGAPSTRSVTETGDREYQVVGPKATAIKMAGGEEDQPNGPVVPAGRPMAFGPEGKSLYWSDDKGCFQLLPYGESSWSSSRKVDGVACKGTLAFTPNGMRRVIWQPGSAGVLVRSDSGAPQLQANAYTFTGMPRSVPDGRGLVGIASNGRATTVVYVPIEIPLPDVVNAWKSILSSCEVNRFTADGGLFREQPHATQLYESYDLERYGDQRPLLVTTDVFWEDFAAAFEGTFILQERQLAMPAFWDFVQSADAALMKSASTSRAALLIDAIAHTRDSVPTGESKRIAQDSTADTSSVTEGGHYDYAELRPRSHYTSSAEMKLYFRAVHYFTEVSDSVDLGPLAALPADVQAKATRWIDVYRPYIAPSRAGLVWANASRPVANYARETARNAKVFPLSWGFDNEVMDKTVNRLSRPPSQQIMNGEIGRLAPSGVDIAGVLGNRLAMTILKPALDSFANLGPVMGALTARRPTSVKKTDDVYDQWLAALAVEWTDSTPFPGMKSSPLWDAKRLQTGLASWATIREATILVNDRPSAAEAGEGGEFEQLIEEMPRGYVEPSPKTFEAIASNFEGLATHVARMAPIEVTKNPEGYSRWDGPLREGILKRLTASAASAREFGRMAEKELRGDALADSDYEKIRDVGAIAEHEFKLYKSLGNKDLGLTNPQPMMKVADVFGGAAGPNGISGVLEVGVGRPLEWAQVVPFFGRREIVTGSVYSYYEFFAAHPYDNEQWRSEVDTTARPSWVKPFISPASCTAASR